MNSINTYLCHCVTKLHSHYAYTCKLSNKPYNTVCHQVYPDEHSIKVWFSKYNMNVCNKVCNTLHVGNKQNTFNILYKYMRILVKYGLVSQYEFL